jgi:hypothetical protein
MSVMKEEPRHLAWQEAVAVAVRKTEALYSTELDGCVFCGRYNHPSAQCPRRDEGLAESTNVTKNVLHS